MAARTAPSRNQTRYLSPLLLLAEFMETGNPSNYKNPTQMEAKKPAKPGKEPLKVKYISSPVMVNAKNAQEFKALVQELTGKDSGDGHPHTTPAAAGSAGNVANATMGHDPRLPRDDDDGGRNANVSSYEVDHSSAMAANEVEDDVFWKLPDSLSRYEFRFG